MRSVLCILALLLSSGLLSGQDGPPFVITRDGVPAATIVLAAEPTRAAQFAAGELQYHLSKITGTTLPVATDEAEAAGPRVLVGESAATRRLGLRSADLGSQEYLIKFLPDTLILMGRDEPATAAGAAQQTSPVWTDGKFGKALEFDGADDLIEVADCGFSDEAGTMEAWVWLPEPSQEKHGTILRLDGSNPWTYHIIQRIPDSSKIGYWAYDGSRGHVVTSAQLSPGWHHVMATHSVADGRIELFVDGVSQGATDYVQTTCRGAVLGIGALARSRGNVFRGIIDEVRVSHIVRDPATDAAGGPYAPDAHTTLLLHFDEGRGSPRDSSGRPQVVDPPGWFDERGTLSAVHDFLERFCDVRWYAPTDLGIVHPTTGTLTVRGSDLRRRPAMKYRWMAGAHLYMPTSADPLSASDATLWKLRMRLGGSPFAANHSFYGYYDRFLEAHRDWFAKGYEGKPPQMCFTSPEFIAQVVQDARDYFDGEGAEQGARAMGDFFALVPMDNGQWCKCDECQAQMNPAEIDNEQFTNAKASDYIWGFVNKVARQVAKTHPGKYLSALAYADYAGYPAGVDLEPNIAVMMCLTMRHWWAPGMEQADRRVFDAWVEHETDRRPLYLWLYYCFPALNARQGKYNAFPGFFAHTVARQMTMYHQAGIDGIFLENSSEVGQSYLMDQLEFYLTYRLADDPTLDAQAMIEEFFTRYYGAAAVPMRRLYCAIEDTFMTPDNYPPEVRELPGRTQHQNEEIAWGWLGTDERMEEFGRLMDEAKTAAKTDLERQRVALFERGIWDYMVEGKHKYTARADLRARPLPTVTVPRDPGAGARGDPAGVDWSRAALLDGWRSTSGDPTARDIEARVIHDGEYLYLRLQELLDPTALVSDDGIWRGDDWELFFAAQRARPYRQMGIAPDGKYLTLAPDEPGEQWDSGALVLSDTSAPDRWTLRLAFPLDRLLPGGLEPGGTVYANFCRATPNFAELLSWIPTFCGHFNETGRFGQLVLE